MQHVVLCGLYSPNIKRRELMSTIASNQLDTTELELIKHISHTYIKVDINNNLKQPSKFSLRKGFRKIGGVN